MDNIKTNFPSQGQLESASLNKFFLTVFKILPCHEVFLVTLVLPFNKLTFFHSIVKVAVDVLF